MGLDNGISIKTKNKDLKLPKWLKETEYPCYSIRGTKTDYVTYEVFYWRKCWDLRNTAIRLFECKSNGKVRITSKNIHYLDNIIKYYYFSIKGIKSWNTVDMNDWGYSIKQAVINLYKLMWLHRFMNRHKNDCYIYFYDSY